MDFTLSWQSRGRFRLKPGDGMEEIASTLQDWKRWHVARIRAPRTVGKTTALTYWCAFMLGNFPWAQVTYLSSTPDVSLEAVETMLELAREHPHLQHIKPRADMTQRKTDFDIMGRRGKGRSVRCRSVTAKYTGLRAHIVVLDDIETRDTVTNAEQRRKVRLAVSEAHNLLHSGASLNLVVVAGTPWAVDSIYDEFEPDADVFLPAEITESDGTKRYPFDRLGPEELAKRRQRLRNELLYRSQYLLDASLPTGMVPIDAASIVFESFETKDLHNVTAITDPAGAISNEEAAMRGEDAMKLADAHGILVAGTRERLFCARDLWVKPATVEEYLEQLVRMFHRRRFGRLLVECNFAAWPELIRTHFQSRRIPCLVEGFKSTRNKHRRILDTLCPAFGGRMIELHEDLAECAELLDQLRELRYDSLPPKDDAIDVLSMGVEKLCPWLFAEWTETGAGKYTTFDEQINYLQSLQGGKPPPTYEFMKEKGIRWRQRTSANAG